MKLITTFSSDDEPTGQGSAFRRSEFCSRHTSGRALIIDQVTTYPIEVCRALSQQGFLVDAFARPAAPVLRSRWIDRRLPSPTWQSDTYLAQLEGVLAQSVYDAIYVCSEEVLRVISRVASRSRYWQALLLPSPHALAVVLSKNHALQRVADAGVPVPRTVLPRDRSEVAAAGKDIGFPLVVKGERGGAGWAVRFVDSPHSLLSVYDEIVQQDAADGKPALQEMIQGPTYVVGGLFQKGVALRLCAHKSSLMYPPRGGATVTGITERPPNLIETALAAFEALEFTGLGAMDFVFDPRNAQFKFLEINPRVWASIGLARWAGVDLFTPYHNLAKGHEVTPDLQYREGIRFHRLTAELRLIARNPLRAPGFVKDCLDPRVRSDFDWTDIGPHVPSAFAMQRLIGGRPHSRTLPTDQDTSPTTTTRPSRRSPESPDRFEVCPITDGKYWNSLLQRLPSYDVRQGFEWGSTRVADGWGVHRFAIFDRGLLVGAMSALSRSIPGFSRSIMYIPRGPALALGNGNNVSMLALRAAIDSLRRTSRPIFLRISAPSSPDAPELHGALVRLGFVHLADDWTVWNSPRVVMSLDIRPDHKILFHAIRRRYRDYISTAHRRGLSVRPAASDDDVVRFHRHLVARGRRKHFPVKSLDYFMTLWRAYAEGGNAVFLVAEVQNEVMGGFIGARLGRKAAMLYSQVFDELAGQSTHAGPTLYWEFIRWAQAAGCETIDWGGSGTNFPPHPSDSGIGVYHFKRGFRCILERAPGYYDLVFNRSLYHSFRALEHGILPAAWRMRARFNA